MEYSLMEIPFGDVPCWKVYYYLDDCDVLEMCSLIWETSAKRAALELKSFYNRDSPKTEVHVLSVTYAGEYLRYGDT
jgi:hypothetical protein